MTTALTTLNIARGQLGYNRWDDPQTGTKYGRWMASVTGQAWYGANGVAFCNMFTSWCLAQAGVREPSPGRFAYVPYTINAYTRAGQRIWDKRAARPGDLVCFDWDGDGVADHIGFIESNQGSYVVTVEGNTSGSWQGSQSNGGGVYRRTRYWDEVCAILRPAYSESAPTIVRGSLAVDGVWGPATTRALQRINGTPQDGVVSGQYAPNQNVLPAAGSGWEWGTEGEGSQLIAKMQRAFGVDQDGIMGEDTVRAMQRYYNVEIDGIMGALTVTALQSAINRQLG